MSTQQKRLRRAQRYNYYDNPIFACVYALGREYHCTVIESKEIYIKYRGRSLKLGTVDQIKSMTVRSIIERFEEVTQVWRVEIGLQHN